MDIKISQTYIIDKPLFENLGLKLFEYDTRNNEEYYVGKVDAQEYTIDIYVYSYPSQFWRFEIVCKENDYTYTMKTGSGAMCDYWETAKLIGSGMIVVTEPIKQARGRKIRDLEI